MPTGTRTKNKRQAEVLPLEQRIQRRAYELYVERGSEAGTELDNWLQAEEEIQAAVEQEREQDVA